MKKFIFTIAIFNLIGLHQLCSGQGNTIMGQFNTEKDLLLAHFDCKTDVDDLHTVAALATLLNHPNFSEVNFHAVAGAYGTQDGLYVPPNDLFKMAFMDKWSDAHSNFEMALEAVKNLALKTLKAGGDIWIPEAGQSDFSAALVKSLKHDWSDLDSKQRIHIVQHSDWNEKVTSQDLLQYVKEQTDYQKIPDGNAVGNGTPGFRSDEEINWQKKIKDDHILKIWELAVKLGNKYNGNEGRYLNEAIAAGGLDFSDLSETCWIFGLEKIKDANAFFEFIAD